MRRLLFVLSVGVLAGLVGAASCGGDTETGEPQGNGAASVGGSGGSGGTGGTGGAGAGSTCDTINAELSEDGLTELSHDDGIAVSNVRAGDISVGSPFSNQTYVFNDEPLHEAVSFELEHPARIHGFKVKWAGKLPDGDPSAPVSAGLYPDFGYNGFDFWPHDALWSGSRCAGDIDDSGEEWTTYVFDEPIAIDHPGLVYVAHRSEPGEPTWWYDNSYEGGAVDDEYVCNEFDWCSSAWNLPGADMAVLYHGLSLQLQYDFLVRLYVEYTDDVTPEDTLFQPVADAPSGGHVAWGDYDNDGWDDLLLGGNLHHNEGDGSFTDVTEAAGLSGLGATSGVWGDYDNDGCLDLFLFSESYSNTDKLMHSLCDGSFEDVTAVAGIVDHQDYNDCGGNEANTASPSAAAAWFDLEGDGLLDLYIGNFNCWDDYSYYTDTVFRNVDGSSFEEITSAQGFSFQKTPSRGVAPIDHDGDGDVDIFVNNYVLKANLFFENNGDGTVSERATDLGLAGTYSIGNYYGHTIGAAWGDIDNDGDFDNVSANLAHPRFFHFSDKTQVLINDGGMYSDASGDWAYPASDAGLRFQETHSVPVLADFDQDGALDLAITCVYNGRPSDFYWGDGDGTFTLDSYHAGITTENGWGIGVADFDHDGDLDLFASDLFENTLADGDKGSWIQVRAVGTTANWAAIGATVRVVAGGNTYLRHVQGGTGKGGQDSLYLHFGLGDATEVSEIRVTYPGGDEVTVSGPFDVGQRLWVSQDGSATPSWGEPP